MVGQSGPVLSVATSSGVVPARIGGALAHRADHVVDGTDALPIVGDHVRLWPGVGGGDGLIVEVLPRTSLLRRRAAGSETRSQNIAANIDVALVVAGLDDSFNLRRIERAVLLAFDAGALPLVVLTKADLVDDDARSDAVARVVAVAPGVEVLAVSALTGDGLPALWARLPPGSTTVLLGVSGAGKSTLTNALLGHDHLATRPLSDGRRGRHTTTHRELVTLRNGAFLIDGPGVRELGLVDDVDVGVGFTDIEDLARGCRFRDCAHEGEPDCAVQAAVDAGVLDAARLAGFHRLVREVAWAQARVDPDLQRARKADERALSRAIRDVSRRKRP